MQADTPLLSCSRIGKRYGGVQALRGVSWELHAGEVHALCGENGAGKSTLARICCGIAAPDEGELHYAGRPVSWPGPAHARRAGIGIILQELDLFAGLSVAENIALGNPRLETGRGVAFAALHQAVIPLLGEVGLAVDPATPLGRLSVAQWQLVAIARVLGLEARVIFMDEPTSALTEDAVERLFAVIARLRSRGVAIVYVSHKMAEIFRISDRVSVMRDGAMIGTSRCRDTTIDTVIQRMVGRSVTARRAVSPPAPGRPVLHVRDLSTRKLRGVSFTLAAGEILGVAGLVASGRSELGRALFGLVPITGGGLTLHDRPYQPKRVRDAVTRGLVLVPEDRRQGLVLRMGVRQNTTLACLDGYSRLSWIDQARETAAATRILARCRVKCDDDELPVNSLSGGNQQKVLIGKWLLAGPRVCFFDDPTRGIDIGAKDDLYDMSAGLAAEGVAVIWVSSELPELLANAHRILVLHEGRVAGILDAADATQERVMQLATGQAN